MIDVSRIERTPAFVLDEDLLDKNLAIIADIQQRAPCSFLMALKGFALSALFKKISVVASGASVSSLNETLHASEFFSHLHAYAPVYRPDEFPEIASRCSHITFNSVSQYDQFKDQLQSHHVVALRINPQYSVVEHDVYNPCARGSRLGIEASRLPVLPKQIRALHSHNLCENGAQELVYTLQHIEDLFGHLLPDVSFLNLGGGHLVTRKGYDIPLCIQTLVAFAEKYPHITLLLEPSAAFVWETGVLVSTVLDVVESGGITTAMLDTSFATHMPDCLEMPYTPSVRGATIITSELASEEGYRIRLGGASCLAGDWVGPYLFPQKVQVGDRIIFEDMIHYTMVKTTNFNGIALPDIGIWKDDSYRVIKRFTYESYRSRLS